MVTAAVPALPGSLPSVPTAQAGRVQDGLVALYTFEEGAGSVVRDRSGSGTPLDLTIETPNAVVWTEGGLALTGDGRVASPDAAAKVVAACRATNELTVEAWVMPTLAEQAGPARIVTLSDGSYDRNFTLGQGASNGTRSDGYETRIRTTFTSANGTPSLNSGSGAAKTALQHVVFTRRADGTTVLFVDGQIERTGSAGGDLSSWNSSYRLGIGNEFGVDRSWRGEVHMVAIYDRALELQAVTRNFGAGPGGPGGGDLVVSPTSEFRANGLAGGSFSGATNIYELSNTGLGPLDWTVSTSENWVLIDGPTSGSLAAGASSEVTLRIDASRVSSFPAGTYTAEVVWSDMAQTAPAATIPVVLTLTDSTGAGGNGRVTNGLVALYDFTESSGSVVRDTSGSGAPLDLEIETPGQINRLPGALSLTGDARVASPGPATKIIAACQNTEEVTVEAWIAPAQTEQSGPARIATISNGIRNRNITLGHGKGNGASHNGYDARLRSSGTSRNGTPGLSSASGVVSLTLQHVVYTRRADGTTTIYVDGAAVGSGQTSGSLSVWDGSYRLALGNEIDGSRPWRGTLHLVAFYDRALSSAEVEQNRSAGEGQGGIGGTRQAELTVSPVTAFTVTATTGSDVSGESASYQVSNPGTADVEWAASSSESWVTISGGTSGTLAPSESTSVRIQLDAAQVAALSSGTYTANVRWTNETNGIGDVDIGVRLILEAPSGPGAGRVTDGLLALYDFEESGGAVIHDTSGVGAPLDLEVGTPGNVDWLPGAVRLSGDARIASAGNASKITDACRSSDEVTLEAWVTPVAAAQAGPARIITISGGSLERNVTLGHGDGTGGSARRFDGRLRSTGTSVNGTPSLSSNAGVASAALQHVVYSRRADGLTTIYVDGQAVGSSMATGDLSNWDAGYRLGLGNEFGTSRPWSGTLHLVAVYDRALSSTEVAQNLTAGPGDSEAGSLSVSPMSNFTVNATTGSDLSGEFEEYALTNTGTDSIDWTLAVSESWVIVDGPTYGTLTPGAQTTLTLRFDAAQLAAFQAGSYTADIDWTNTTNGFGSASLEARVNLVEPGGPGVGDINFWVDAVNGDDGNDGSQNSPWRTLARALIAANAGDVVGVQDGVYSLSESVGSGRTGYVTLTAAPGAGPTLTGLSFVYPSPTEAFIRVEGFEIYSATRYNLVNLENAHFVDVVNCEIHADQWARGGAGVDAFEIRNSQDVLIERNHIHEVFRGLTMTNSVGVTIRRNYILPKAGTAVQYAGGNEGGVIEHNHIQGASWIGYPANPEAVNDPHASVISIRSGDLVIRGNHMHGFGSSSGIMCYEPDVAGGEAAYSNILVENNALYDIDNAYAIRIYNLGDNVVLRNNLLFSRRRTGSCAGWTSDARYRYSNALMVHNVAPGYDGSGLSLFNNILMGIVTVPNALQERNNIVWSWGPSPWESVSPSGTSLILTDAYSGCGNHSAFFEAGFFESTPNLAFPTRDPADWALSASSLGINFGDASVQPSWSLGSIGPDGFVVDDGPVRSGAIHSVGPFER